MSSGPPFIPSDVFNPNLVQTVYDSLSIANADARYIRIGGQGYVAGLVCSGLADVGSLKIGGSVVDLSAITGIIAGTVSASKAVIVDSNKDITGFRNLSATNLIGTLQTAAQTNITSLGTLTGLNLNGSINLSASTTINNTLQWTAGTQPTTGNGIGIRFNGLANGGTGYLRSYNYILSQDNNLDINNGNIYIKNNRYVGISQSSPLANLHCTGTFLVDSGWTSAFTNMNGLIMFHDPAANTVGTSYIRSRNWTGTPADMNLDIQNQALFIDNTKKLGIWTTSPQTRIDVNQSSSTSNRLRLSYAVGSTYSEVYCDSASLMHCTNGLYVPKLMLGDSTDTSRIISALDSTMTNGSARYFTLGKANSTWNSAEISYQHAGDGSGSNKLSLGRNGGAMIDFNFDGSIRHVIGSKNIFNTAGDFIGKVNTSDRMYSSLDGYNWSFRGSSSYPSTEMVSICDANGWAVGTYSTHGFRLISNNLTRFFVAANGQISFMNGTSTANNIQVYIRTGGNGNIPLWIDDEGSYSGSGTSAIVYFDNSAPALTRTLNWSGTFGIGLYVDSGILCRKQVSSLSDRRLKQDIEYLSDTAADEIVDGLRKLKLCSYKWKKDKEPGFGCIAQDCVMLGLMEAISLKDNPDLHAEQNGDAEAAELSIDYSRLCLMMLPYIQTLEKCITKLETRITHLEKKEEI